MLVNMNVDVHGKALYQDEIEDKRNECMLLYWCKFRLELFNTWRI